MGYLGTQIRDGALYVDITPEVLGLPSLTPLCGIPIEYQDAWKKFGEAFKASATTTCPVDTGFLRDNIDFHADDGGVECWSDATYSAYQEYGTYKMAPQPYFEGALAAAFSETADLFNTAILMYSEMDNDFSFLLAGCTGGIDDCYRYLDTLARQIDMCDKAGYDTTLLEDAYVDILEHVQQMEQTQMMAKQGGKGLASFIASQLAILLGTLIAQVLTFPFRMLWENKTINHRTVH